MTAVLASFIQTVWFIVSESALWLLISLLVGGVVHEFLPSSRFHRLLNRNGNSALLGAVLLGSCLPICSCGVIPLAVSLYRSGVRLGPVMAFAAATPIINPAAVILSLALLGPQITAAYVTLGLLLPLLMGVVSERWGDARVSTDVETCCGCETPANEHPARNASLVRGVLRGCRWGLFELGPTIGYYMGMGVLLAGAISILLPSGWTETYLRDSHGLALLAAGVLGATIYVCAVAHVPLVAMLVATSAAPGVAIVFLVTGTATNLPELVALYKSIGKRTVLIYTATLIAGAIAAGALVNAWLMPGFVPPFDPVESLHMLDSAAALQVSTGEALNQSAAWAVVALAVLGTFRRMSGWWQARSDTPGSCSG